MPFAHWRLGLCLICVLWFEKHMRCDRCFALIAALIEVHFLVCTPCALDIGGRLTLRILIIPMLLEP